MAYGCFTLKPMSLPVSRRVPGRKGSTLNCLYSDGYEIIRVPVIWMVLWNYWYGSTMEVAPGMGFPIKIHGNRVPQHKSIAQQ